MTDAEKLEILTVYINISHANRQHLVKCLLEYDELKDIKKDSIEEFVFLNSPITYLRFIGKGKTLDVGDLVMTLRGGFGSCNNGKLLNIIESDNDKYYLATDGKYSYCIEKDTWYMSVFKLIV